MFDSVLPVLLEICRESVWLLFIWSWQVPILLGLTFLIVKLFHVRSAEIRHKIWFAGLVAVALLPGWGVVSRWLPAADPAGTLPQIEKLPAALLMLAGNVNNGADQVNITWLDWLIIFVLVGWFAGVVVYAIRFFAASGQIRQIVRDSKLLTADFYESSAPEESSFAVPPSVELRCSPEVSNPALIGLWHPIIMLPAGMEEWTSLAERRAVLRHELAHLERRDHIIQIFQTIIQAVLFFHPVVRYGMNQLSFERELACDEKVIGSGVDAREYTEIILKVAERDLLSRTGWQLTFTPKNQLNRRISKIMNNRNQSLSKRWRFLLLAKTAVLLALVVWFVTPDHSAAQNSTGATRNNVSTADEKTTESFKRLYESMKEAMLKGDKTAFENFFADDYTAVSARGTTMTKEQVIAVHIQKPNVESKLEKVEFTDFQVKTYGDTVIVSYLAEMSGIYKGAAFSQKARITDVWEKNGDRWQSVASHASTAGQ